MVICASKLVSAQLTFYIRKRKYAHLGVSKLRQLRQVEEENARLKRLVADMSLDKHIILEVLQKKESEACPSPGTGSSGFMGCFP